MGVIHHGIDEQEAMLIALAAALLEAGDRALGNGTDDVREYTNRANVLLSDAMMLLHEEESE